jgi:Helix-turn-helix domain
LLAFSSFFPQYQSFRHQAHISFRNLSKGFFNRLVPLSKSARSIGLPLVESLKEILDGHLVLIDTDREIPLFQRFVLSENEVKRFLEARLKAERSNLNLLSVRDVTKILDVGEDTLREWVRKGVLVGRSQMVNGMIHGLFFQREIVDLFRRTYVLAKEAAEILDVHSNTIYKYVARGILHPIGLPRPQLFLREEVEALIPPDMLSIPQAAALLNMSASALYARVEAGYIPYVQLAQCPENKWLLYSDLERFQDKAKRSKSCVEE